MTLLLAVLFLLLIYFIFLELYPIRRIKAKSLGLLPYKLPSLYLYSFEIHLHSQFSYDSLGKPEDILDFAKTEEIDYVITTDHDNDYIKYFADHRLIAGIERKVLGEGGSILGDLLLVDDIRVVAHPFKEKYRWKMDLPEDYLFELIDLKDALLERKDLLFSHLPYILIKGFFSINYALEAIKKLIPVEKYALLYLSMGIKNPIVGGLDHHVKVYIREVGVRFLFPHYKHSFRLMRNFLISEERVESKEDFLKQLKKGHTVISFSKKPTLYWKEEGKIKIYPSERCLLIRYSREGVEAYKGSYFEMEQVGTSLFLAYTYKFQWSNFYFGLKPLFIFLWKEEKDGRDAFARGNKGEDSSKGLQ